MISLHNVTLCRGTKLLFKDVSLNIFAGERIGLVGSNGSGKSSLFSLLLKELEQENGTINYNSGLKIGHLSQDMPISSLSACDYVMGGNIEVSQLFNQLTQAEKNRNYQLMADFHLRIFELNGYKVKTQTAKILVGLGFAPDVHNKRVEEFSDGWKMRLNLARILMLHSDLLLLDEPTNYLDLEAIIWLEKWLSSHAETAMLISHDREFLDKIVQQIWHIDQQKIISYNGNYTSFERQYTQRLLSKQNLKRQRQKNVAQTLCFINRFRAKASKAKQVQSRIKALNKLENMVATHIPSPIKFEFREDKKITSSLVNFDNVSFGYAESNLLLNEISFSILPKVRIGLLGENGIGKSSLVKIIVGELNASRGNVTRHNRLKIGYFSQSQVEDLTSQDTALGYFIDINTKSSENEIRVFLGQFGFTGEMVFTPLQFLGLH